MKIMVLPDCQVKPHTSKDYLKDIGKYMVDKKPDHVICIGDFADMEALSSYDVGKKSFEGRRYKADIEAAHAGMAALMGPMIEYNKRARKFKEKQYLPGLTLTLGNHEERINRVVEGDPKLDGTISISDLHYEDWGWTVHPFLDVVFVGGVAFSHYFVSGVLGRPVGSAAMLLSKKHQSCIAGHQQGLQISMSQRADGRTITGVIAGSAYEHDEDYMGPQGNKHWRGILMLHNCNEGEFDLMPVPLHYLRNKYATKT